MARSVDDRPSEDFKWDAAPAEVQSDTKLESDTGSGKAAIIRRFTFKANPQTFKNKPVTKQDLFNAHLKQIEIILWQDGLKIMTDVQPALAFNKKKTMYTIIVGAVPQKGQMLTQTPNLLKDFV